MMDLICATRLTSHDFWTRSALGLSLQRISHDHRLKPRIAFENHRGLPSVYNERIDAADAEPILAFIHDDVWLDDHFFFEHVSAAVNAVDIIGVAGNRRRVPGQPSWAFPTPSFEWDAAEHLSGTVCHGQQAFGKVAHFGPVPASCELLDGVLLATRRDLLRERQVRFDERFDFHFYDMDFCRSARQAGLWLATWPIAITHQSSGRAGSPGWRENYDKYLAKWGE
jgi:GT2 family glycosyltransferase